MHDISNVKAMLAARAGLTGREGAGGLGQRGRANAAGSGGPDGPRVGAADGWLGWAGRAACEGRGRPRMISRCSVTCLRRAALPRVNRAAGPGRTWTVTRGYRGPPAPDRAAFLSQQAALRRPGGLRPSPEPGTRRRGAPGRGVLRAAVPRPRPGPTADRSAEPGPVPGTRPVQDATVGRVPGLGRRA